MKFAQSLNLAFAAWVRAASLHEPRERMGVSHLLEHMVFKGTKRRTSHEIALSLEALGGSLDAYTSRRTDLSEATKPIMERLYAAGGTKEEEAVD